MLHTAKKSITPQGYLAKLSSSDNLIFPGVRGVLKENITLSDGNVLKAGTEAIIQPLNKNKPNEIPEFIITPFTKNSDAIKVEQPESNRNVITTNSYTVKIANPEHVLKFNDEHFRLSLDELFPTEDSPSIEEVNQCRIPNCFLLAAIQAVINHPDGKSFIRGMMKQNEDGTTIVRLFDPVTLEPEYISVETSVITDGLGELNLHRALWVHILEKAYAARGKKNDIKTDASVSSVYANGGKTKFALQSLTGVKAEDWDTKLSLYAWQFKEFLGNSYTLLNLFYENEGDQASEKMAAYLEVLKPYQIKSIYDLFNVAKGEISEQQARIQYIELFKYYKQNEAAFNQAMQKKSTENIPEQTANIMAEIFKRNTAFSGYYNIFENNVFNMLKQGLAEGKLATASTPAEFDKKVPGIVTKHAYTILDVIEKPLRIKNANGVEENITAKFVRLRNPWGNMDGFIGGVRDLVTGGIGRTYTQHTDDLDIKSVGSDQATFHVELNDFCSYFYGFSMTDSANSLFALEAEKEKYITNINTFSNEFTDITNISDTQLSDIHTEYQQHLTQLIYLELLDTNKLDANLLESVFAEQNPELVKTILDEKLVDTSDELKAHIINLLDLARLHTQDMPNMMQDAALHDAIQAQCSRPELWGKLNNISDTLKIGMMTRVNAGNNLIDDMKILSANLQKDTNELKTILNHEMDLEQINQLEPLMQKLFITYSNLEIHYDHLKKMNDLAGKFGYPTNNDSRLKKVGHIIQQYQATLELIEQGQEQGLLLKFKKIENTILELALQIKNSGDITEKDYQELMATIAKGNFKISFAGVKAKELNEKLQEADGLLNTIKHWLEKIKASFVSLAERIGTLFHAKNSYDLPPIAQANKIEVSP